MFLNEIEELTQTTKDLIDSEPIEITLIRETWTRKPGGGQVLSDPEEQDPITCWLSGLIEDAHIVTRDQGEQIVCRHVLVAMPGADVKEKDYFIVDGRNFLVAEIHPAREFQTKAWLYERTSSGATV